MTVFTSSAIALAASVAAAGDAAPPFLARAYFMDARKFYSQPDYAAGTNSVLPRYVPDAGADGRPDAGRRRIPDEPVFRMTADGVCRRDIGGWTGLKTGVVWRAGLDGWRRAYVLEAMCGADEATSDIAYELSSFGGPRALRTDAEYREFKASVDAQPGATRAERAASAARNLLGMTADEVDRWRRRLVPETDWVYSLVDQVVGVKGDPAARLRLSKGWNEVRRDVEPVAIGGPEKGKPIGKVVRWPTPPPFPGEQARPADFTRIDRKWDDHEPLVDMATAEGWSVEAENAEARFYTTDARGLYRDTSARLEYRADCARSTNTAVRLRLVKPVAIDRGFDASSLWLYGNFYAYDKAEGAQRLEIVADYRGADGREFSIKAGEVTCAYWFLCRHNFVGWEKKATERGATFLGFTIRGFQNEGSFLSLDFARFSVFRDETEMPRVPCRPKRPVRLFGDQDQGMNTGDGVLPFPTTKDTIVPPVARQDPELEFRFPARPDESWDDLAFRYGGGEWIRVAIGGGVLPRGAGRGGRFEFRRVGDSIVCDMHVKGGRVKEVIFGDLDYAKLPKCRKLPVPYYLAPVHLKASMSPVWTDFHRRPGLLVTEIGGRPFFVGAAWDWTQSAGSRPYCESEKAPFGGIEYFPKTDGTLADCCERLVWSFSREPVDALANIPNPPSAYRHEAGCRAFAFARSFDLPLLPSVNPQENETRERLWDYWRKVRRLGVRDLNVNGHEKMWRDYMDSFTFKTNAAPLKGGDAAALDFARRLESLGFRVGPYNNFTDLAPVNENWSPDRVVRTSDDWIFGTNELRLAWTRTYLCKPVYAVHAMETLLPEVRRKFGFRCAYSDVHTAYPPWGRVDFDSRMPGAGSMAGTFYSYGELMQKQKDIWEGPVYSEGWGHVVYAGLSDGDIARDDDYFAGLFTSAPDKPWDQPWIVDYDLKRIHPLNCCIGTIARNFYGRHAPADPDEYADRHVCHVLAFGHAVMFHNGFLFKDNSLAIDDRMELRNYFMPLAAAKRYTQANAVEIRYGDAESRLLDTAHAIASNAVALNRVRVAYSDGTVVAVNAGREGDFVVECGFGRLSLGPNCYAVGSPDGTKVVSAAVGGHRADLAVTRDYVYIDGRGKFVRFDEGASDGMVVRLAYTAIVGLPLAADEEDVVVRPGATVVELPYEAKKVVAYDLEGAPVAQVRPEIRDGRTVIRPLDGAVSYRVQKAGVSRAVDR